MPTAPTPISTPKRLSLPEVNATVSVSQSPVYWRRLAGFLGPGFLIAVGYMDPGNWATDIAGGARYGYTLLFVIMLSNLMAILLQSLSLKLGIATERDLAQMCHEEYGKRVSVVLWIMAEIAIAACDMAEVIGSAIALNLLFHIPLFYGVLITGLDVMVILLLQKWGFRYIEALVIALIGTIVVMFGIQVVLSRPDHLSALASLFIPSPQIVTNPGMLYIAIGILGATVMPHNLYLHSSIVQSRNYPRTPKGKREAIHLANIDSALALTLALFVNAADEDSSQFVLTIGVHFRKWQKLFQVSGGCSRSDDGKGTLNCGVECDGGRIDVSVKNERSVLVAIPYGARTWDPESGDDAPDNLHFGADDKLFRLDRADLKDCLPIIADETIKGEIAAMK